MATVISAWRPTEEAALPNAPTFDPLVLLRFSAFQEKLFASASAAAGSPHAIHEGVLEVTAATAALHFSDVAAACPQSLYVRTFSRVLEALGISTDELTSWSLSI